jgi:hypothetical protein
MICDTCIRKQGKPSGRESKQVKKKQKAKNGDYFHMADQTKNNDWWDGNKPTWCTDSDQSTSWEQSATSKWDQKTNEYSGDAWETKANPSAWDPKNHETSWGVNPEFNDSTGWDLNQNTSTWSYNKDMDNNKCTWNSDNNCSSWDNNQYSKNSPGWGNDSMQRSSNFSAPWNDLSNDQVDFNTSSGCENTNTCGKYVNNTPNIANNSGGWSTNVQNGAWHNRHNTPENNGWHGESCWHNNQCKTLRNCQSEDRLQNRFQDGGNPSNNIQNNIRSRNQCVCNWRNCQDAFRTGNGCATRRCNCYTRPTEFNRLCGNQGLWQKNTQNGLSSTYNARINTDRPENYHNSFNNERCCSRYFENRFHDEGCWFENQGQSVDSQHTAPAGVPSFCPTGTNTGVLYSKNSCRLPQGSTKNCWIWVSHNTVPHTSEEKTNHLNRNNSNIQDHTCSDNKSTSTVQRARPSQNQVRNE